MKITILGSNSAIPAHGRMPTAQVLQVNGLSVLIDCGEGTQLQLSKFGIKRSRIEVVCISHLHGDHVFGLAGFISSFNHFRRSKPLLIIGPEGIDRLIDTQLELTGNPLNFKLNYKVLPVNYRGVVYEDDGLSIRTFPVDHRIPTFGYLFETRGVERKIDMEAVEKYDIPRTVLSEISKGGDYRAGDKVISNEEITVDPPPPKRYAFVTDTDYLPVLKEEVEGVDLLYHESTFMQTHVDKARETKHTTAKEAAEIARHCGVKTLMLGHYSSRYRDLTPLLQEAKAVFPNTMLAVEGEVTEL